MSDERSSEYLFKMSDGKLIYVSVNKKHFSFESFAFYMGVPRKLVRIEIVNVQRYLDGGTTYLHTVSGMLYAPSPIDKIHRPYWKAGKKMDVLEKLDPSKYDIVEYFNLEYATVKRKKKK